MSFQTGTSTDPEDLISDLFTFLTGTPGWTQNYLDTTNDRASIKSPTGNVNYSFEWNTDTIYMGMHTGLASPLGSVAITAEVGRDFSTLTSLRQVNEIPGPHTGYWFFEDADYCHVVLEFASGRFRHFGFGKMPFITGAITGGDYQYGAYWSQTTTAIDNPFNNTHAHPLGGSNVTSPNQRQVAMYIAAGELPEFNAASKWFYHNLANGTDPDGDPQGGLQTHGWSGGMMGHFMSTPNSQLNGFKPLMPIPCFSWQDDTAPDTTRLLGYFPDVRAINMDGVTTGAELSIGGDIWIPFPIVRQLYVADTGFNEEQSYNFGLAYKKVTT